jgi:tetratricopeptide (TPR) repeat protein
MTSIAAACLWLAALPCGTVSLEPSPEQLNLLTETIDYIFADSFAQAYRTCNLLDDPAPGRPVAHLLYAGILHAEMLDAEEYDRGETFLAHIDSTVKALKKWVDKNPDDPWGYFFLGSAYGYRATWHGQKGSWLKSLIDGLKAKGKFSKALKLDSTLYDAYTGIGNYHYWSSARLGKYIPLLPDSREKGLQELRLAVDSSLISTEPAAATLGWALIHEKRLSEAAEVGQKLYARTSGGRASLWIMGSVYWYRGNLNKAEEYYSKLLESLMRTGNRNYYNLIFCRYRMGVSLFGTGRYDEAREEFETILSYDVPEEIASRHKETFEKSRYYLERLEKRPQSQ